jgi:ketosteroid isomerase-like protein
MKTVYAVMLCVLLLLFCACAQKVNDPADVQAVKKSVDDYAKAVKAEDTSAIAALMTDKTIYAHPNVPVLVGSEAVRVLHQSYFDRFRIEFSAPVEDVRIVGDLAVARGTRPVKATSKAQGLAGFDDDGSWIIVFARQEDGSWKWDWLVANSNRPLPGTTADGAEEKTLIQLEHDFANGLLKSDTAVFDRFLAKEWTYNADGQVIGKTQMIAEIKSGAYKLTAMELSELSPHVFGDVALVAGTMTMKGKYKGSDIPGPIRSTDFFVKRDGRWQAVSTQNITIK